MRTAAPGRPGWLSLALQRRASLTERLLVLLVRHPEAGVLAEVRPHPGAVSSVVSNGEHFETGIFVIQGLGFWGVRDLGQLEKLENKLAASYMSH